MIFSCVAACSGLWALAQCVFSTLPKASYDLAVLWWQIGYMGVIFTVVFFTHFVVSYLKLSKQYLIRSLYVCGFFFLFLNWYSNSRLFLGELTYTFNQFYWHDWFKEKHLSYLIFYISFYWIILGYDFLLLLRHYKDADGIRRSQIKYFLVGAAIGWLSAELLILIDFRIYLYPYTILLMAVYPIIIGYSIVRYRLMDIRVAITRAGIFTVVYGLVLGIPFIEIGRASCRERV